MREGWETKTLGEVCQIKPPKKEAKQKLSETDFVSFVPMKNLGELQKDLILNIEKQLSKVVGSYTYFADNDVLLAKITPCFENGKLGIARNLKNGVGFGSSEYVVFRSLGRIEPEYLFYFLSQNSFREAGTKVMTGAVGHKRIPKDFIETLKIPLPPLAEQKRIVGVLDAVFAGIGVAEANARKNLANARELFETTLNDIFTQKSEGWVEKRLGEACQIKPPKKEAKEKLQENELVSFLPMTDLGVCQFNAKASQTKTLAKAAGSYTYFADNDVLLAKITPCFENGKLGIARNLMNGIGFGSSEYIVFRTKTDLTPDYLFFFLSRSSFRKEGRHVMTGAVGHKRVPKEFVENYKIPVPPLSEQEAIVSKLIDLSNQTQRLEAIYKQKLADLAELKQSLLQKAFAGELTASSVVAFPKTSRAVESVDTTTPEFTANVICLSQHLHAKQDRGKTFGRVKAQKELHLTESIGRIDLGRIAVKGNFGPNDSAHMRGAENWAKEQKFFEFVKRPEGKRGYDFIKLARYDEMRVKAFAMIKPYRDRLEKVADLLIWKDTEQAEVFATVHAAWNNLIIDNAEITDDAIIYEARENWHSDKLNIDKSKFKTAIQEIKQKNLQPDGSAKYVGKQQERLI